VEGRPKHIFSIWRKMNEQNLPFEQIFDLVAFRIIVSEVQECYSALGVVHSIFKPIPGRFKDYISLPKNNGYRSLHTAVVGLKNTRMEVQIRTRDMHNYAEDGIAAHWRYKDGGNISNEESQRISDLRAILSWQSNLDDPRAFLNSIKESLADNDYIYVFTPAGEVKELPLHSTPLDFAYSIHSDVGNHCSGARVNGLMTKVSQELKSGDTVEILTSRAASPRPDWLRFVVSPKARTRIRQWLATEEKKEAIEFGRDLIVQEMRRFRLPKASLSENVVKQLGFSSMDELNSSVAFGKIALRQVIEAIEPSLKPPPASQGIAGPAHPKPAAAHQAHGVLVRGVHDVFVRFGKCCTPVPGEPIVGFLTKGHGVTVHTTECQSLIGLDAERLIEVSWDSQLPHEVTYDAYIRVQIQNVQGGISKIVAAIAEAKTEIIEAHTDRLRDGQIWFRVAVTDYAQYSEMINSLKNLTGLVTWVQRFYPAESEEQMETY
jgi:GTP pyrophosphokinase